MYGRQRDTTTGVLYKYIVNPGAHGFQITEIFVQAQQNIHFLIQLVVCLTLGWTLNSLLLQLTYHVLKNLFKSPYVLDAVYERYKFITEFLPKNCTLLPLP